MELIKKLSIQYELGPSQIFVSGFSNGAMFSQRLATDYPEAIAGIVSAAGVIGANNCELKPKKPVAMLMMHGKLDKNVPMSSGYGLNPDFSWKSFDDTVSTWKHANKTKSETVVTHEDITETNYEKGSKPLRTMVFSLYKHSWPGWRLWQINRRVPRASKISVDFFDSL